MSAEYRGVVFYQQHGDGESCVPAYQHDGKVQEIHDHYRARLESAERDKAWLRGLINALRGIEP